MNKQNLIHDAADLDRIIRDNKKAHPKAMTNNILFFDTLNSYAKSGRLSYEIYDDGMVLLYDTGHSYLLSYYIAPDKGIPFFARRDKPVIIEFHERSGRNNKQNKMMIPYWENAGFEYYSTVRRMTVEYDDESIAALENAHQVEFEVITAHEEHLPRILELLYAAFDPLENMFHSEDEMLEEVRRGEFICITGDDGNVAAAMRASYHDGVCNMHHVVVDPLYRGKNLSWHLRRHATKKAYDLGIKKREGWVVDGNTPGIESAKKIGLAYDGRYTIQFILKTVGK